MAERDANGRFIKGSGGGRKPRLPSTKKSGTWDFDHGFFRIRRTMELARRAHVTVGWHGDQKHPSGMSTAELATIHEYGANIAARSDARLGNLIGPVRSGERRSGGEINIPARPTLGPVFNSNQKRYREVLKHLWLRVLQATGQPQRAISQNLLAFGEMVKGDVVKYMNTPSNYVPNAPSTVAKKGSSQPLFDDGDLRRGVDAKVEIK